MAEAELMTDFVKHMMLQKIIRPDSNLIAVDDVVPFTYPSCIHIVDSPAVVEARFELSPKEMSGVSHGNATLMVMFGSALCVAHTPTAWSNALNAFDGSEPSDPNVTEPTSVRYSTPN